MTSSGRLLTKKLLNRTPSFFCSQGLSGLRFSGPGWTCVWAGREGIKLKGLWDINGFLAFGGELILRQEVTPARSHLRCPAPGGGRLKVRF